MKVYVYVCSFVLTGQARQTCSFVYALQHDQLDAAVRTELDGEAPHGAAPGYHVGDHISVIGLAGSRSHRTVLALNGANAPMRTR